MKTADGSFHYCYNDQAVVDSHQQVIVAAEMTQAANDYAQLVPMMEKTVENLGQAPGTLSVDTGYCSAANLACAQAFQAAHGTEFFISTGPRSLTRREAESPPMRPWENG